MESSTAAPSSNLPGMVLSDSRVKLFAIQGEPTTGKTTAMCTFPDIHVMNFDEKLPPGIKSWPFYSDDFIHSLMKTKAPMRPNRKEAILRFLREVAPQIPATATLGVDSYTIGIDNMHNLFVVQNQNLFMSKGDGNSGPAFDPMKGFADKLMFNIEFFGLLRSLACQVVVTFHEQVERDAKGGITGRFKPLATGQFKDQLAGNFGNIVRAVVTKEG